ncbi:MAG TPA: AbrB/MazE/SpoVT family DNA-binding domain-containing protein [Rhizomicrobium sp.]
MRITSKGQVTIPVHLREKTGLLPNTEVDFVYGGRGKLSLVRARKAKGKSGAKSRGEIVVEHLRRFGRAHPIKMTTDEIMALTRGDD